MKTSAVATGKRRSLLPAPRNVGSRAASGVSAPGKNSKEITAVPPSVQPAGTKHDIASTSVGPGDCGKTRKGSMTEGNLAGNPGKIVPSEGRVNEPRQTRLSKPSNLQRPTMLHKRPASASSALRHVGRELSSAGMKTSADFACSGKVPNKQVAASPVDAKDQNVEIKERLETGSNTRQRKLPLLRATNLKLPAKYSSEGATVVKSTSFEVVSEPGSSCLHAEDMSDAGLTASASLTTGTASSEDVLDNVTQEHSVANSVEEGFDAELHHSDGLSDTTFVAGIRDVLSSAPVLDQSMDDSEPLASSCGSLGILHDAELLDSSLMSFELSLTPLAAPPASVVNWNDRHENSPGEDPVELLSTQSTSTSAFEVDPTQKSPSTEVSSVRPQSLMSDSSTDYGIVADCVVPTTESHQEQQRPISYMSSSSADTGTIAFVIIITIIKA